ncbi:hypothetical protein QJQ45_025750, partial [Haematococcus lacustris]
PVALQCLDPVAAAAPVEKVVLAAMVAAGNADWDSYLELFQIGDVYTSSYCGGTHYVSVDQNDNASPTCQFGSELSTLTRTLTTGLTYWLFLTQSAGRTILNSTIVVVSAP